MCVCVCVHLGLLGGHLGLHVEGVLGSSSGTCLNLYRCGNMHLVLEHKGTCQENTNQLTNLEKSRKHIQQTRVLVHQIVNLLFSSTVKDELRYFLVEKIVVFFIFLL